MDINKLNTILVEDAEKEIAENNHYGAHDIILGENGEEIFNRCFGSYGPSGKPLDDKAMYRLASMTKPITAIAVLMQEERGKLSLDDKVSKYIPSFRNMEVFDGTPAQREITLLDLTDHTSGLCSGGFGDRQYGEIPGEYKTSLKSMVNYYGEHAKLDFSPGTKAYYSGLAAFDVLAHIVELTSDMEYEEFLKKNIFEPLEMTNTTFEPTEEQWANFVAMHRKTDDRKGFEDMGRHVFANLPVSYHMGGAGLAGTATDYAHFCKMLLCGGVYNGKRIIGEKQIVKMSTPQISPDIRDCPFQLWGIGVRVLTSPERISVGSFGWSGAYGSHFWIDPTNKFAALHMKNTGTDGGSGSAASARFEQSVMKCL